MKIFIGTCAKDEQLYIKEWVEYHLNIGIDCIIIKNNDNDNRYEKILKEYINQKKVIIWQSDDIKRQDKSISKMYNDYKSIFDWIAMIDIDEFIELPNNQNIHEFIESLPNDINHIVLPWVIFNDNDQLYYEDKPVRERFKYYILNENPKIKSIYKNVFDNFNIKSPHLPYLHSKENIYLDNIKTYGFGQEIKNSNLFYINENGKRNIRILTDLSLYNIYPYLAHYKYKSLEEHIKRIETCQIGFNNGDRKKEIKKYFYFNNFSKKKLQILKNHNLI